MKTITVGETAPLFTLLDENNTEVYDEQLNILKRFLDSVFVIIMKAINLLGHF